MSLSYKLDVTNYPWWNELPEWLGNTVDGAEGQFGYGDGILGGLEIQSRWFSVLGKVGAPTGEYIIRDGYYHNGIYIIVGSYRAYWQEFYNTGAPGFGWDGFILMHRGYNVTTGFGNESGAPPGFFDPQNYTFFPMMWPTTMLAANTAEWDNETQGIGLYAVAPVKTRETATIGQSFPALNFAVCGQHITKGKFPTDVKTIASFALLNFTIDEELLDGSLPFYTWDSKGSFQIGPVIQTNVDANARFGVTRSWQDTTAMSLLNLDAAATPYEPALYEAGCLPDGTNPSGGVTSTNNSLESNGYHLSTAFGMRCVTGVKIGPTLAGALDTVFFLTGQMSTADSSNLTQYETPYIMGINASPKYQKSMKDNVAPWNRLSFYSACTNAFASGIIKDITQPQNQGWFAEDITDGVNPSLNEFSLSGAAGIDLLPPAEIIAAVSKDDVSPMAIVVGNMQYNEPTTPFPIGLPRAGIFLLTSWPAFGEPVLPWGTAGGALTTATGAELPSRWHHTLQQYRTYSFAEENESMRVALTSDSQNDQGRTATDLSVYDNDTKQFVGYIGNFPRYDDAPNGGFQGGVQSFQGYAAVGWYDPTDDEITAQGPCLFSYDKGTPSINSLSGPVPPTQGSYDTTGRLREDGSKLSAAIGTFLGARQCVWAGWDNDRDQWLFITTDTATGVDIISVDAPFTTFLKQSAVFQPYTETTDWTNAKYFPISMSNALDGLVVFGELVQDIYGNTGIQAKVTGTKVVDTPWNPAVSYTAVLTSQLPAFRITGSTGRTSRVWIDYMLYDGVDSVIAMQLRDWGMRVTVENVEWFKARILQNGGDLTAKSEEIEEWMEQQGKEYQDMLKQKERSGRLRKRRSQISGYAREVGDLMTRDQMDTEVYDFVPKGIAAMQRLKDSEGALKSVPPDSIEAMVERDYRAGFDTTPSGVTEPGDQLAEDPAKPAGTFMDTGDAPKKAPDEGGDPDEEYISEN